MIRRALAEDADRLGEIHVAGWRTTYRGKISDEYLFTKHLVVNSTKMFRTQIDLGAKIAVFVDDQTKILKGFIWVGSSRETDLSDFDEVYAYYVQPEFKRQGVGSSLMNAFLAADEVLEGFRSSTNQFLWVLKENDDSVRLYEKFGFQADGHEKIEPTWENILEIRMQRKCT